MKLVFFADHGSNIKGKITSCWVMACCKMFITKWCSSLSFSKKELVGTKDRVKSILDQWFSKYQRIGFDPESWFSIKFMNLPERLVVHSSFHETHQFFENSLKPRIWVFYSEFFCKNLELGGSLMLKIFKNPESKLINKIKELPSTSSVKS
jgi:hypothetical protein